MNVPLYRIEMGAVSNRFEGPFLWLWVVSPDTHFFTGFIAS
jgi:hypothetical protein